MAGRHTAASPYTASANCPRRALTCHAPCAKAGAAAYDSPVTSCKKIRPASQCPTLQTPFCNAPPAKAHPSPHPSHCHKPSHKASAANSPAIADKPLQCAPTPRPLRHTPPRAFAATSFFSSVGNCIAGCRPYSRHLRHGRGVGLSAQQAFAPTLCAAQDAPGGASARYPSPGHTQANGRLLPGLATSSALLAIAHGQTVAPLRGLGDCFARRPCRLHLPKSWPPP